MKASGDLWCEEAGEESRLEGAMGEEKVGKTTIEWSEEEEGKKGERYEGKGRRRSSE